MRGSAAPAAAARALRRSGCGPRRRRRLDLRRKRTRRGRASRSGRASCATSLATKSEKRRGWYAPARRRERSSRGHPRPSLYEEREDVEGRPEVALRLGCQRPQEVVESFKGCVCLHREDVGLSVRWGMSGEGAGGGGRRGCRERVGAGHPRSVESTRGTQGAQPVAVRVTTKRGQGFSPGLSSSQPRPGRDANVHRLSWAALQTFSSGAVEGQNNND